MNRLYIHDETLKTGDGEPIEGQLESGHIAAKELADQKNSFVWLRLSRVFYYIRIEAGSEEAIVQSEVGNKTAPMDTITYNPVTVLDSDFRHDIRLTDKIFSVRLTTNELVSLSDFSFFGESAGTRA